MNGAALKQAAGQDMGGLARLPGLHSVCDQLAGVIAVIQAEQARQDAAPVSRRVWKNLVFTGGPGCGKSRAAAAVGRIYRELGVLAPGHLTEVASVELAGADAEKTRLLVSNAASRARGGVLMITDADAYADLRTHDQQVLRFIQDALTVFDDLTVVLAGQPDQLRTLLHASPPLASRFPWVISFPRYTTEQLTAIFAVLASEAGFAVTAAARRKASTLLASHGQNHADGSARQAVRLLDDASARQARRITAARNAPTTAEMRTIRVTDIPDQLDRETIAAAVADRWPGQYL